MVNFSCSDLLFPSEPSPGGCAKRREIPSLRNAGLHFSATIEKPLRRWTSSPCQQSLSVCSTAFLSSATIAVASCTLTSHHIRRACGLSSSCGKPFPMSLPPDFLSLIGMPRMARRFPPRFDRWESNVFALLSRVLGRRTTLHTAPPGYAVILPRSRGAVGTALRLVLFAAGWHLDVHTDSRFCRCRRDRISVHGDSIS